MSPIAANLQAVRRRISEALQGDSRAISLVAVTKSQAPEAVRAAFAAGCGDFGESYVQEAVPKIGALKDLDATWHFIGHLQGNKAREVAQSFDWVHGVDRAKIAAALAKARPAGRDDLNVCVQVNISGEPTKGGVQPSGAVALAREVAAIRRLRLRGLMGMASPTADLAEQRRQFAVLKRAFDEVAAAGIPVDTLSMGMSDDFEAALAEGATMVRIGTAIFGERTQKPGSDPNVVERMSIDKVAAHELGSDPE
jgi:pyridoxal phosphate enzyme (YggS family)